MNRGSSPSTAPRPAFNCALCLPGGGMTGALYQIGALAALEDQEYLADAVARIARARGIIGAIARANSLEPLASAANFVTIDCGRDGAFAKRVLEGLLAHDVFARMPSVPPLNRCIRVSCGRDEDLAVFADVLPLALASAR